MLSHLAKTSWWLVTTSLVMTAITIISHITTFFFSLLSHVGKQMVMHKETTVIIADEFLEHESI
jgi:hypothetical protein